MNIVKGVADLLRRSTSERFPGESTSGRPQGDKFTAPAPHVRFSEVGDEAVLHTLWERHEKAIDKVEKRKLFHVFLKQFLIVYKNWEPASSGLLETATTSVHPEPSDTIVIGCSVAHPADFILILTEELIQLTVRVFDLNTNTVQSTTNLFGTSTSLNITSEGLLVLDALTIITRSMHNCKVFSYYGGTHKLTALMKGVVVQLKTIAGALSSDESDSNTTVEMIGLMQRILVYVVSIIHNFIEFNSNVSENTQLYNNTIDFSVLMRAASRSGSSSSLTSQTCQARLQWHQKAVMSVMEAGGLNWLVELLRVIRRLCMKEVHMDIRLMYLTLRTLHLALYENSRGQSHFKSIGGLEVLLDGLGLASNNALTWEDSCAGDRKRDEHPLLKTFKLHALSLEVLREAVFGNVNNLQFLCENGRVHKFANSFCSLAFMLQEFNQQNKDLTSRNDFQMPTFSSENENKETLMAEASAQSVAHSSASQLWNDYVVKLSEILCSFLLPLDDNTYIHVQQSAGRVALPVSSVYIELSLKWVTRVLSIVFPCIKACSNENKLPSHSRVFFEILQHSSLNVFMMVLASQAAMIEVFREEGMWKLMFSEDFFYFGGSATEEFDEGCCIYNDESLAKPDYITNSKHTSELKTLQMEILTFVEFAATLDGSVHNLPELSVLLDALEKSACDPGIASVLANRLLKIMELATEKSIASLKTLDAVPRILNVVCIQAQESRSGRKSPSFALESDSHQTGQSWLTCMETLMSLFSQFVAMADDAGSIILHSSTCIDCLFELFWEEGLRNSILQHILHLMMITSTSDEDRKAKLQLCSKYLEMFTQIKEREQSFIALSIDLLGGMRDIVVADPLYYQALFRDGECFLHVISLLNGNLDVANGEELVLNVLQTITRLLASNDASKAAFRTIAGKGYQTLHNLLLDFCQCHPSEELLNALLDMLVDGKFDIKASPIIQNEDVIILYMSVLQKSSDSMRDSGLKMFQQLLRDSLSNRASCVRAGMLSFLLDWFSHEDNDTVILKIAQLIQVIGGHSISGKDIRKIFALLRSEKVGTQQQYCSLLLSSVLSMLNEKGPTAFFDLNGSDSGILIKTPVQWPLYKGFSFSCWLRVENFPRNGTMGLFSFLSENGRGCLAVLSQDRLIFESINLKRQCVKLNVNLDTKKWHFLCITHTIGRAFSGGSLLRCYMDGELVSSERCRYAKVNELLTKCTIGSRSNLSLHEEDNILNSTKESIPFFGQIGPVYLFNDTLSSDQVLGIHSLGPSYMYSFLDNETAPFHDNSLLSGILDAKEGLASKIVFGLNAQASDGRRLSNVSTVLDLSLDKTSFEATVMIGTQLCSRRLLQQIIYCVGGVSVFFPLIIQADRYENEGSGHFEHRLLIPITKERLTAEVIELIASVLDENLANQQQMHLLSGFKILGFLLQSVPPPQLNLETLSALKHLFNVVANCGLAEVLVRDAISSVFLNPLIWLYTVYKVQRELYMFLIEQFDNDPRLLKSLCQLPRVLDIIRQFYWDNAKSRFAIGSKPLLHPVTKQVIGERPTKDEIRKIRLLFLSLGEMSLRENITAADINALIAFFETSQDMTCIEDVLHMVIRAVSQKQLLASFLEQVNLIGGPVIFINLLQRECEPIRLLSLQFIGRLLVGIPSEKKGTKIFNIGVGRSKFLLENPKKLNTGMEPIFAAISDRLFSYPQTDNLCATLFDVLLGGASPKQVLQKHSQLDQQRSKGISSHFLLPQILVLIFRFLTGCDDASARMKIIKDLLDLLDSNASNFEAFLEYGWNAWLSASVKLDVLKDYKVKSQERNDSKLNEQHLARNLFCLVLCHCMHSVKGGWQQLEETVNFLLLQSKQGCISYRYLLRDVYEDLIRMLLDLYYDENIFVSQPCRDNTLYLLKLVDELLLSEIDYNLPFPSSSSEFSLDSLEVENSNEMPQGESIDQASRDSLSGNQPTTNDNDITDDKWWYLYDNIWIIIGVMNGKGPSKMLPKSSASSSSSGIPSLGQRARGLVESLNIPAVEMAAVVASAGGIGNALGAKPNKSSDKAMLLRGERCPRIVFRLLILYMCKASLERASRCVQQVISLLPCLLVSDDEQSKSRLQLFIRALITVRSKYGMSDDGARFHVISHVLRETVNCGKSILATSIAGINDYDSSSNFKETGSFQNLIQMDRVLAAVADEARYIKASVVDDRTKQLQELYDRIDESYAAESSNREIFEDEIQSTLNTILASDDSRRASFQLTHEEQQQNVSEKWLHMFRTLIDERGPWSANPFPNSAVTHWKLDKTEDSWRRRPKLRQNYQFDERLCNPPSTSPSNQAPSNVNESKSNFAGHIPERMKQFLLKGVRKITDEGSAELGENDTELSEEKALLSEDSSERLSLELVKDNSDQSDIVQEKKDPSSSSLEQESSEVLLSVPCVLVIPKRKLAGHLAIKKNVLHFFGEFLVEGTGGQSVFNDFHASSNSETSKTDQRQNVPKWPDFGFDSEKGIMDNIEAVDSVHQKKLKNVKRHRRWSIGKIRAVHWTRYLLRYSAIEIFFSCSTAPVFLNFASQKDAKQIGTLIVSTRNEFLHPKGSGRDKTGVISFVDRRVALEMAETARESWRRRDMTNFEYLMTLNTLAGRSYNDLTQYPVFPWIVADYTSDVLDFNKSSTFRDLSKPVGALDQKRFEVFEDRYQNFSDPDIPSFYYGSHYSSMGIVLYYLIRLEPFTTLHRGLQGGKFDHADRLFQSVEATYRNCLSNTSDVKELIPEFYYMPECLANSNSYHLGVKQDGSPISDVILPPWAKGSPEEFVYRNREALESEYVSSNLHHWIDLVFGYKQRGKPAVEAANIFYYLTYEGAVDLETMEDDLQRLAIEDQIANFGQTPIQVFRKKHPRRGPPIPIAHPLRFAPGSINLTSIVCCTSLPVSAVVYVDVLDSNIVLVNQGLSLSVKMWLTTQLYGGNYTFSASQDPYFGVGSDILSPRKIGSPLAENVEVGTQCFATMQMPFENFLVSCGNWENSFQVISLTDGRVVQSIRQHKDVVSCVAVTSDGSILATGSYDTTVMVWEVLRTKGSEKRVRSMQMEMPRKDCVIIETPFHILCGHDDIITCLYVSVELDIVISGSKDGTCVFHTLQEGRYVRSLRHPSGCALSKLVASRHGRIVLYSDDDLSLHLYSINGKHLATSESNGRLSCVELSKCGEFLVCAGDQGQVTVRSMNSLGVVKRYGGIGKTITSLKVTMEECFLAGTKDGNLLVYSIENSQHRKTGVPRNVKFKAAATG